MVHDRCEACLVEPSLPSHPNPLINPYHSNGQAEDCTRQGATDITPRISRVVSLVVSFWSGTAGVTKGWTSAEGMLLLLMTAAAAASMDYLIVHYCPVTGYSACGRSADQHSGRQVCVGGGGVPRSCPAWPQYGVVSPGKVAGFLRRTLADLIWNILNIVFLFISQLLKG